jgi:hypothetical protein
MQHRAHCARWEITPSSKFRKKFTKLIVRLPVKSSRKVHSINKSQNKVKLKSHFATKTPLYATSILIHSSGSHHSTTIESTPMFTIYFQTVGWKRFCGISTLTDPQPSRFQHLARPEVPYSGTPLLWRGGEKKLLAYVVSSATKGRGTSLVVLFGASKHACTRARAHTHTHTHTRM